MSNTGVYKWDPKKKRIVRIGYRVTGSLTYSDVTFTKPFVTADITGSPVLIENRHQKKVLMERHNVQEAESSRDVGRGPSSNRPTPSGCSKGFVSDVLDRMGVR